MGLYQNLLREFGPQRWWPTVGSHAKSMSLRDPTRIVAKQSGRDRHGLRPREDNAFEIMVGAILTQNTAWRNVEQAIGNLIVARALSPEQIVRMPSRRLERLVRPAGYFRQKAKKLKIFSKWYMRRRGSLDRLKTPDLRRELLGLWGIGPETADSILLYALARPVFVVDAYTRRFMRQFEFGRRGSRARVRLRRLPACNALRSMAGRKTDDYHELQQCFMDVLPRSAKLFNEFHALIVAWGKHQR